MNGPVDSADGERTPPVELLTASVSELDYGLESGRVLRVTAFEGATPVPGSVPEVDGVANVDGRVTLIVDAAALLTGAAREPATTDELLVLDRGERRPIGLRTPHDVGVETVPAARIGSPPSLEEGADGGTPIAGDAAAEDGPATVGDASTTASSPERPAPSLLRAIVEGNGDGPRYLLDVAGVAAAVET